MKDRWDIFCRVIDNFGDIGVTWRLARQLAAEYDMQVRLWVDDLESFRRLNPVLDPGLARQSSHGVEICHWTEDFPGLPSAAVADVVIEAFACELPPPYVSALAQRAAAGSAPVWINLDYLSAEAWVAGCHGMASPHPTLPLTKHFFFPGFSENTGGLPREAGLMARRDSYRAAHPRPPDELRIFLFCYDNPALPGLLAAWRQSEQPIRLRIPPGAALSLAAPHLASGQSEQQGALGIDALPFVAQEDFDASLWNSDINFVRGEDSLVRGLWAGRPLVWQIYAQAEDAHLPKLNALLEIACAGLPGAAAKAQRDFWLAWNGALPAPDWPRLWQNLLDQWPALAERAANWSEMLAKEDDLASRLVNFRKKK